VAVAASKFLGGKATVREAQSGFTVDGFEFDPVHRIWRAILRPLTWKGESL